LVSGEPYKPTDQDTYEQLMTIEDKEIRFWKSAGEVPPFVEECGINWQEVLEDYDTRQKQLEEAEIKEEVEAYNKIIDSLTKEDVIKDIEQYPLRRYGNPEEIAYAIIYLLSDASAWVTGTNLVIDGGRNLK